MAKSIAEHRLEGTLHSRHKEKIKTEEYFGQLTEEGVKELTPPASLFREDIKQQYIAHSRTLLKWKLLNPMDIGSFNAMYETLQEANELYKVLQTISKETDIDNYLKYTTAYSKLINQFTTLAKSFFVSPAVRQKMTLNQLEIEQKKNESAIGKLLKK